MKISQKPLSPSQVTWLPILLVSVTVLLAVPTLAIMSGCGEGSLHINVLGLDYQFTKKGGCDAQP